MLFNTNANGYFNSFFYYKGDIYIDGTEIALKDEYIKTHQWDGKKLWKYAKYDHQCNYQGRNSYWFCISGTDYFKCKAMGLGDLSEREIYKNHAAYFVIPALELDRAIEGIPKPIKLERAETEAVKEAIVQPKSEFDNSQVVLLWIVYIIAMIGSLIFKQFYLVWMIITFVFLKLRKEMLNK